MGALSLTQAAKMLGCSRVQALRLMRLGELGDYWSVGTGERAFWRVTHAGVVRFLNRKGKNIRKERE